MYRKPGSPGALKGVLSGPYAGDKKVLDAAKLPRAARQRLADVVAGRAEPTPILHEHPSGLASRFRATWGVLAAIIALATLTAIGFADPRAAWAYQPPPIALGYASAVILLAFSILSLYRRRALASGGALVPGRYLLPLDVVEITAEDAGGEQLIVVTPLGKGRDARVRSAGKRSELVLVFDGGSEISFILRSEREGEHALRRLEHAQTLLEELTYARDLEKSLVNDAFFDLRVDDSWASLAPSGPASRATRKKKALLHGSVVTTAAVVAGGALGCAAFAARNWASDRALFLRALRLGTTESFDAYLVRGTSHREEAESWRARLLRERVELAKHAEESRGKTWPGHEAPPRSEWELTAEEAAARRGTADACVAALRQRASTAHPEAMPIVEALIARARRTGDPVVPVRIDVRDGKTPAGAPELDLHARASRMVWAFERVFSEQCPAAVLKFVYRKVDGARVLQLAADEPGLDVKVEVTWPKAATWSDARRPGLAVYAPKLAFDVALRGEAANEVSTFRLTVSPPEAPPTSVRPRSLFVVPVPEGAADGGPLDASVYPLLEARAFDRLYDELYGLVFRGDPRVPLRDTVEEGPLP